MVLGWFWGGFGVVLGGYGWLGLVMSDGWLSLVMGGSVLVMSGSWLVLVVFGGYGVIYCLFWGEMKYWLCTERKKVLCSVGPPDLATNQPFSSHNHP